MTRKPEHLGGDRWRVRVQAARGVDGRYRELSRSFRATGPRDANKKARKIAAALDREAEAGRDRAETLNGLIDEWLRVKKRAPSTEYRNRSIVKAIRDGLGPIRLEKLTARDIDLWYGKLLADGKSETTVHHYHRVLHSILSQGERHDRVAVAPTRKADPPDRNRPKPSPPRTDDLARVLAAASPGVQIAALIAARAGLRRGEVCGLRWGDLRDGRLTVSRAISDVPGRGLEVKVPKTKQQRTFVLDAATTAALEARRGPPDAYVLADPSDPSGMTPRAPGWLTQAWNRLCKREGVHIRFHDLRHWSASNMLDAGVPIKTVSNRLGHSLTSTTLNIYTAELPGADEAAAAALGERLPDPVGATRREATKER